MLTVEKSAKETWTFSTNKDTKGTAKVGDKVTVYYTMVATEIEAKAATPTGQYTRPGAVPGGWRWPLAHSECLTYPAGQVRRALGVEGRGVRGRLRVHD